MRDNEVIRKGATEMILLCLLEERDMYGYELRQEISDRSEGLYAVPEGTMYVFLYRLAESGYISERKELVGKRRTRVYYHLEPSGQKYLDKLCDNFEKSLKGLNLIYSRRKERNQAAAEGSAKD